MPSSSINASYSLLFSKSAFGFRALVILLIWKNWKQYYKIKNQLQILCILNLIKFGDLKICILGSTILSFFYSSEYKVFEVDILHGCGIYYWLHPRFFFQYYLKLKFFLLIFLNKQDPWSSGAPNLYSLFSCIAAVSPSIHTCLSSCHNANKFAQLVCTVTLDNWSLKVVLLTILGRADILLRVRWGWRGFGVSWFKGQDPL